MKRFVIAFFHYLKCLQKQIIKAALSSVATRVDILVRCDARPPTKPGDNMDGEVETYVYTLLHKPSLLILSQK